MTIKALNHALEVIRCFDGRRPEWSVSELVRQTGMPLALAVFGFLTTAPNAEVGKVRPKAMPVILTNPDAIDQWLTAPVEDVPKLQRHLPNGTLRVVATGMPEDIRPETA